ncbi:dockerin type I domain-containing protein [Ruminococcus albus]|uniref:dockerin type I domain-containing protein n=1 Tax=Ruminococcus albus TaxID=1264 RepID=UPI000465DC77|nr:dockerin type I domain-containing protein [Ruminococcus albus]
MKTRSIETRFLSIVLSLLMVLTMLPAASFKAYADTGSNTPLTFTAQEDNSSVTIKLHEGAVLQYSTNGEKWNDYTTGTTIQLGNSGDTVYFRGTNKNKQIFDNSHKVSITGKVACSGNIMTLVDWQAPDNAAIGSHCFSYMFFRCTGLTTAPELPATTLADYCYCHMFNGCTSLTTAPELPATNLAHDCYLNMFDGCTGLTTAPELPATTLAESCYYAMFYGCTSLTTAPELPATNLVDFCYYYMFNGCTGLTTAPELPATTLADCCYYYMFNGCTGLTIAPNLPATTLAESCYEGMFYGCTGLTTAPELPATNLVDFCYYYMFYGCTGLTTAPELPATTLANSCYFGMFSGCTGLTIAPKLPATTLANYCYSFMFYGCTGLTTAPELPATTLANYCYFGMFYGCTGIMLSTTQTEECNTEYRIPSSGEGTASSYALTDMFNKTGGTFTGTPDINTIYYTVKAHTHNFTYTASDAVITATCDAGKCDLTENKVTLTITAPTLTTYDGTGSASATLTGLTDFNDVTGKTVAESDIKYVGRDNTVYEESTTAPTDAGNYTASITVEEKTAAVDFTIAKADLTPDEVTDLDAIYGQTLANVTLPTANDGTWAWEDDTTTSVGNAGMHTFKAVFTPSNTNYNTSEQNVTVNVAKADPTPDAVTGLTAVTGKTLADVKLPVGWAWNDDTLSVGDVGNNSFAATYTPEDTDNYNTLRRDLTVTVTVTLLGDVNFDGKINTTDIVKVAAHVKGKKLLDKTAARAADVNGDSIINVTDIIMIAAHVKGKKLL